MNTIIAATQAATELGTLTDIFGRVMTAARSASRSIFELRGPGSQNEVEAEIQRRQFLRVGAERGLVGVQNPTEAEIQRRQFTRVGAARGLVGIQNVTEAEIMRRLFTRVGGARGLVGTMTATEAEIFRRMVFVTVRRGI